MVDVGWMSVDDGWSQERSNWRKEKLELVSAVASAVAGQLCDSIVYYYLCCRYDLCNYVCLIQITEVFC